MSAERDPIEQWKEDFFREGGLHPHLWKRKGQSLRHAAKVLADRFLPLFEQGDADPAYAHEMPPEDAKDLQLYSVWWLLAGLTLEVLAKGVILAKTPCSKRAGKMKEISKPRTGHDLERLLADAGLADVVEQQRSTLRILSESVRWAGKYVLPKCKDKVLDFPLPPSRDTVEIVEELAERLEKACC